MIKSGLAVQNRPRHSIYPSQHFRRAYSITSPYVFQQDSLTPIIYDKFENEDIPSSVRYRQIFGKHLSQDDKLFNLQHHATKQEIEAQKVKQKRPQRGLAYTTKTGSRITMAHVKKLEEAVIDESTPMEDVIDYYDMMREMMAWNMFMPQHEPLYQKATERIRKAKEKAVFMDVDKPERIRATREKIVPMDVDKPGMSVVTTLPATTGDNVGMKDGTMMVIDQPVSPAMVLDESIPVPPPPPDVQMDVYAAESVNKAGFQDSITQQLKKLRKVEQVQEMKPGITQKELLDALTKLKPATQTKAEPSGITKEMLLQTMMKLRPAETVKRVFESTSLFTPQELVVAKESLRKNLKRRGSLLEEQDAKKSRTSDSVVVPATA